MKPPIPRTTFATDNPHVDGTAEFFCILELDSIDLCTSIDVRVEVVDLRVRYGK